MQSLADVTIYIYKWPSRFIGSSEAIRWPSDASLYGYRPMGSRSSLPDARRVPPRSTVSLPRQERRGGVRHSPQYLLLVSHKLFAFHASVATFHLEGAGHADGARGPPNCVPPPKQLNRYIHQTTRSSEVLAPRLTASTVKVIKQLPEPIHHRGTTDE